MTTWYPGNVGLQTSVPAAAAGTVITNDGINIYTGGDTVQLVGGVPRNGSAEIDTSGNVLSWNPNIQSSLTVTVRALQVFPINGTSYAYVGGTFNSVNGGVTVTGMASFDTSAGSITTWAPPMGLGETATALAFDGADIFMGGSFSTVSGTPRAYVASTDPYYGNVLPWNPSGSGGTGVLGMASGAVAGKIWIYAGGSFSVMGGSSLSNLAKLDNVTGAAASWLPNPNGAVYAVTTYSGKVLVGGAFTSIGGLSKTGFAAIAP